MLSASAVPALLSGREAAVPDEELFKSSSLFKFLFPWRSPVSSSADEADCRNTTSKNVKKHIK